jgi:hypothetical protein
MLDVLIVCGQVLCLIGLLYGAYLAITQADTFRAGVRVLGKIREAGRRGMTSLEAPASGEEASKTASALSPSRAGFFPAATAQQPVAAGVFFPRFRRRSARAPD